MISLTAGVRGLKEDVQAAVGQFEAELATAKAKMTGGLGEGLRGVPSWLSAVGGAELG